MGQDKSKPKNQNSLKSFIIDNVKQSNSVSSSVAVKTPEMIIFGINAQARPAIFSFDSTTELLSDFKMKNESQYRLFNYSQAVNLNDYLIIVTGGTSKDKNQTSGNAGIINLETGEWKNLPNMTQPRFSHISICYDNKIFVFGGRSKPGDENILNHCEYLSIENESEFGNGWIEMPKSLLKRCTGFSIVYNEEIYLIGGYTGQRKRSKKIEKFNQQANMWQFIELRLLYGVERGVILSGKANEFIIFGGKIRSGDTKQVYVYDLLTQSYSYLSEIYLNIIILNLNI